MLNSGINHGLLFFNRKSVKMPPILFPIDRRTTTEATAIGPGSVDVRQSASCPTRHSLWQQWLIVGLGELGLLTWLVGMFWYQDWRYSLPTPRPANWQETSIGTGVRLPASSGGIAWSPSSRPVLLHFFNPDCPCSRFNLDHVRKLHRQYADRVDFVVVLEGANSEQLFRQFARLDLPLPAILDADRTLAHTTGVYATPQAVILDNQQRLFYRGNYNTSRYCTAPQTEFARLALEALLQESGMTAPMSAAATRAYGCSLPVCLQKGAAL